AATAAIREVLEGQVLLNSAGAAQAHELRNRKGLQSLQPSDDGLQRSPQQRPHTPAPREASLPFPRICHGTLDGSCQRRSSTGTIPVNPHHRSPSTASEAGVPA